MEASERVTILHVDMDAFYAAVEVLDDPSLRGRPLIVGGDGQRGVVAACSYEARAYGVRSAMPSLRARQLCPHAEFRTGRFGRYEELSRQLHGIFSTYTPLIEGIAFDEAFLDVAGAERLFGPAPEIAAAIRARVAAEMGLPCSVGVARTKFLAKLASRAAKPVATLRGVTPGPGVVVVWPSEERAFLDPLPVEALWGVGPATAARLHRLGVTTVRELADVPRPALQGALGKAAGEHLYLLAAGIDERAVEPTRELKSVGHEETYPTDRFGLDELRGEVVRMADAVAGRMRRAEVSGRTVTVKVRYGDFMTITRARTVATPLDRGPDLAAVALEVLGAVDLSPGVRLLGVSVSQLGPAGASRPPEQLALALGAAPGAETGYEAAAVAAAPAAVAAAPAAWAAATDAMDAVRRRFGDAAVGPASLVGPGGLSVKRRGDSPWGPSDHGGKEA